MYKIAFVNLFMCVQCAILLLVSIDQLEPVYCCVAAGVIPCDWIDGTV